MKSAISIIVTVALSGPLLGARTGWKLTVSADMAAGTENRDATANSSVRTRNLFMSATPFHLVVKLKGLSNSLYYYTSGLILISKGKKSRYQDFFRFQVSDTSDHRPPITSL
jgi:hypothetical protein